MKRLTIGLMAIVSLLIAGSALADVKQKTVPVKLIVYQIIELDVTAPAAVIPDAEDYAYVFSTKNGVTECSTAPADAYGFASRHDAINVTIFTNASKGATVHFAGKPNPDHNKSLLLQDIYLSVMREKTYVLANSIALPDNLSVGYGTCQTSNRGIDGAWAVANTSIDGTGRAKWIQAYTEAKQFFGVTEKTEASRLWILQLGIASLAEYEENLNGYEAELTFILMPNVV